MSLYEMTPDQVWNAWKEQKLTVGEMLSYQTHAGIYFSPNGGAVKKGGHSK